MDSTKCVSLMCGFELLVVFLNGTQNVHDWSNSQSEHVQNPRTHKQEFVLVST